jgi:hypothetical protein
VSAEDLAAFGDVVVGDEDLQRELLATDGTDAFAAMVVQRARELGWEVSLDDVGEGIRARRRGWLGRWV